MATTSVLVLLVIGLYFLPTIVAASRRVPNAGSVAVINFFFGWTFIGWVIALSMAARSRIAPTVVNVRAPGGWNFVQPQYQPPQYPVQYGPQHQGGGSAYIAPQQATQLPGRPGNFPHAGHQDLVGAAKGVAPGWHPDPYGNATRRYWDGQRWTEHTL